jgi:D-serine deaminase-like pyridoxal phosphate-dependent protein
MFTLTEPTLLLDKQKCIRNIQMIVEKAQKNNIILRPHFKTHQAHEIGRWFRIEGVTKITVSSLKMAEYFAQDGWNDITVAFPVNVHEKERINRLASTMTLNLLVVSPENIGWLAREVKHSLNIFIEVDNGYHRTGVSTTDFDTIDKILLEIAKHKHLHFAGFLGHAGHSYKSAGDKNKILAVHQESSSLMIPLKEKYKTKYPDLVLSTGDTPTCSVAESFSGIDEIRPGNLVFYDVTQEFIGSCSLDQVAVAMACPVVAIYPERNEVVVHGGGVHFSKDSLTQRNGTVSYGNVVTLHEKGWSTAETGMYIKSLSQEHGVIHAKKEIAEKIKIGDFLGILPIHSCLTVDAMRSYLTTDGELITTYS